MDVKKRWSKKEKSLKSDPAPENTKQNTKILVNDLFFLYSFSYEIFVTWKFELFSQCFFTVVCLSSMLMHCNASTWLPINVNPQGLATFFGPHLPLYCTCNISCYESSSEIYSMEIKISLSLSLSLKVAKRGEGGWVGIYANWTGMLTEFSLLNQRELHSKNLFLPFLCPRSEKIGGLSEEYRMSSSDRSIFSSIHKRTLFRQLASVLDFKFSESCNLIN